MTIERLCRDLGPGLIRRVVAPAEPERAIGAIVVAGVPEEITAGDRDALVLAVGARDDAQRLALLEAAARHGALGLVVKADGELAAPVREAAQRAGVALLATDPEVSWARLHQLIGSAVRTVAPAEALPADVSAARDLFALADATASATGAPVTIEDADFQVLAFSREGQDVDEVRVATILGRRVPGRWASALRRQAELDGVLARDEPAVIEVPGMAPRRVIAIRSGGVLLGSIWLAGETDDSADEVLREAAAVAALQLLRRRAERELEHAARSAAVAQLLQTGELSPRTATATALQPADAFCVVALAIDDPERDGDVAAHDQLAELLAAHLRAFRRRAVHGVLDGRGYVIAGCDDADGRRQVARRCADGLARARRAIGARSRAGIGALAADAAAIPDARATARRALELAPPAVDVALFDDVRAAALVEDVERFVAGWRPDRSAALATLLEHDRAHGTELVETLRVVLELFGDTATAAQRLHVHANTVRYRLRQAAELTGLRLTDGPRRLALELELRALARGLRPPAGRGSRSGRG